MARSVITVREKSEILEFGWDSLYAYCGPRQIIASALVFRLLERAFGEVSPEGPPDRDSIRFLSGFPGIGIAECVELVTRIGTRHPDRYVVVPWAGPNDAPKTAAGSLYFEVQAGGRRAGYWPSGDFFDDEFRAKVARFQEGGGTADEQIDYFLYKRGLSSAVLSAPAETLFRSRPLVSVPEGAEGG